MRKCKGIISTIFVGLLVYILTPGLASASDSNSGFDLGNMVQQYEGFIDQISNFVQSLLQQIQENITASLDSIREEMSSIKEDLARNTADCHQNGTQEIPNETDQIIRIKTVSTAAELSKALRMARKGSVIELAEGVYHGQFSITQDNIILRGKGNETVMKMEVLGSPESSKFALNISGENCQVHLLHITSTLPNITGIQISGARTTLTSLQMEGFTPAVKTHTDGNQFTKISIKDSGMPFYITANHNILSQIQIKNMIPTRQVYTYVNWPFNSAVLLKGNFNSVSNLTCDKCFWSCSVEGNNNSIQHVQQRNSKRPEEYSGIWIESGSGNSVNFYTADGYGVTISRMSSTSGAEIRNVVSTRVWVAGTGHTLFNVDSSRELWVEGSGHRIEKCKAWMLINSSARNVTIIDSTFNRLVG